MANLQDSGAEFQRIWQTAWNQYKSNLPEYVKKQYDLTDIKWSSIRNVDDLASIIEADHTTFDKETSRHSTVSDVVKGTFGGLNRVIDVIGGAAGTAFPPCSQALGAIKILIDTGLRVSKSFDALSGMFEKLGGFLKLLEVHTTNKVDPRLEEILRQLLVCMLKISLLASRRACHDNVEKERTEFGQKVHELRLKSKSKAKEYFRMLFAGDDQEISSTLGVLQGLVEAERQMTAALTKKDTSEIKDDTSKIKEITMSIQHYNIEIGGAVFEIQDAMVKLDDRLQIAQTEIVTTTKKQAKETSEKVIEGVAKLFNDRFQSTTQNRPSEKVAEKSKEQSDKLSKILEPSDARFNFFTDLNRERLPHTGDWILDVPQMQQWLAQESQILVVLGNRGSGKTFLASRVVSELQKPRIPLPRARTCSSAYFFCRRNITEMSDPSRLLRSLAFQIAETDKLYASHISSKTEEQLRSDGDGEAVRYLWEMLISDFYNGKGKASGGVTLVLDGIDECQEDDVHELLTAICASSIRDSIWQLPNVQILIHASAETEALLKEYLGTTARFFSVSTSDTKPDMEAFIDHRLELLWSKSLVTKGLRDEVRSSLTDNCRGNFLWTSLVLKDIASLSRESDIRFLLANPPANILQTILTVLTRLGLRLDEHGREDLNDILSWVTTSKEDLSLAQLDSLMCVRNPEGARVINLEELITSDYSSLFTLSSAASYVVGPTDEQIRSRRSYLSAELANTDMEGQTRANLLPEITDTAEQRLAIMSRSTVRLSDDLKDMFGQTVEAKEEECSRPTETLGEMSLQDMRLKTLLGCLRVMCDDTARHAEEVLGPAYDYCAKWLPEHLANVNFTQVGQETKCEIGKRLLRLLRDDELIDKWVRASATWMTNDLLSTNDMSEHLVLWLRGIESELDGAERQWVVELGNVPSQNLFFRVAQGHARRWLQTDEPDTEDHFRFLSTYINKFEPQAENPTVETRNFSFAGSDMGTIVTVAKWANFKQNSTWHYRLADSLRIGSDGPDSKIEKAIELYTQAANEDTDNPNPHQGLFWAYRSMAQKPESERAEVSESYQNLALKSLEKAVELYDQQIRDLTDSSKQAQHLNTGYFNGLRILGFIYDREDDLDRSLKTHEKLLDELDKSEEPTSIDEILLIAVISYFNLLMRRSMFDEAVSVLQRIVKHPRSRDSSFYALYENWLYDPKGLLRLGYNTGKFDLVNDLWNNGLVIVAQRGDEGEMAAVCWFYADAILRLSPERKSRAISLLEKVESDDEIATPANRWHFLREKAVRELARIHSADALEARDGDIWSDVSIKVGNLRRLAHINGSARHGYKTSDAALILAAWNRMNGRNERAKLCAWPKLKLAFDMLYNTDENDDDDAWTSICNTMLVVGDIERSRAAWGVLGSTAVWQTKTGLVEFSDGESDDEPDEAGSTSQNDDGLGEPSEHDPGEPASTAVICPSETTADTAPSDQKPDVDVECHGSGTTPEQEGEVATKLPETAADDADREEANELKQDTAQTPPGYWFYSCDGPCLAMLEYDQPMYRCACCITDFCQPCFRLLREGGDRSFEICSTAHEWYKMPPIEPYEAGKMKYLGKEVDIQDWLDALAEEWHIERPRPETTTLTGGSASEEKAT